MIYDVISRAQSGRLLLLAKGETMANDRFIYDEKTSRLYAPDGTFLKKVMCPKAMAWNQLTVDDGEDRWRGCEWCQEKVFNLDAANVDEAISAAKKLWPHVCLHATKAGGRVIFLKDEEGPPPASSHALAEENRVVIHTARNVDDINRAVGLGYWPDIRVVKFDTKLIRNKLMVRQHRESGRVVVSSDYRSSLLMEYPNTNIDGHNPDPLEEVIPFFSFYPHFQEMPIAAYLVPKGLPDGTPVLVVDPIEDILGSTWNQGDTYRAENVPGYISAQRVVLEPGKIEVSDFVG